MRLTLRTMLAYMDDVLEPADQEVLGKKIEESDFAAGLVDRIRGVLRKLRMDAPKLDGKGMGNDANTVSEYLDSSLPQDRVGEFERVCLESDKHLCEVAACHQVLTLVLGKPADVPPELRERVYALAEPERSPAAKATQPQAASARAAVSPPPVAKGNGHATSEAVAPLEVPEYLKSGQQTSLWPLVLVTAATLLFVLGVLRAMAPFDERHPLARMFAGEKSVAMTDDVDAVTPDDSAKIAGKAGDATATEGAAPAATDSEPASAAGETAVVSAAPAAPPGPTPETPPAPAVTTDRPPADTTERIASTAPAATSVIPEASAIVAADTAPTPTITAPSPVPVETPPKPDPIVAAPARTQPMEVGRYISDGQLLATLDATDGLWYPKQSQEILVANERMVVLPPYRPQIALPSAVQLTFAGEGSLRLDDPSESPTPRVVVEYGRFLAATAGRPGAQVELDMAGIKGVLTLVDADSVMAIKVVRWLPPGSDPEASEGIAVIEMYNSNGRAAWQQAEKDKVEIAPRYVHVYYGADPPETHGPFLPPDWIDSKSVKPIDRETADKLERMINVDRPLNVSLQEVTNDRRVELRALTARCLAALGDFEPALRELADPNQYSFWSGQFDALRAALSRGPETAAKVRETITLLRAANAKELNRLLWGYSEEQLAKGAATELVRFLEHDQIDVRVLAHANLVSVTGAWGFYRPERSPAQMRTAIQNWRDRLSKGAVVYRSPPSPLDTYKPAAPPAGAELRAGTPAAPVAPPMR